MYRRWRAWAARGLGALVVGDRHVPQVVGAGRVELPRAWGWAMGADVCRMRYMRVELLTGWG